MFGYAAAHTDSSVTVEGNINGSANGPSTDQIRADGDDPWTSVMIRSIELDEPGTASPADEGPVKGQDLPKKKNWLKRHLSQQPHPKGEMLFVQVRRSEYEAYFAKDKTAGHYKEGVMEPPGGRREWVYQRLVDQKSGHAKGGTTGDFRSPIGVIGKGATGGIVGNQGFA